jgi:hypothetical protein
VIRDEKGNFIVACNDPIQYAIYTNTLESPAISRGITMVNNVFLMEAKDFPLFINKEGEFNNHTCKERKKALNGLLSH